MALFIWTEKFISGLQEIDQQHKKIVDLINALNDIKNEEERNINLYEIIIELISYTKTHLSYEENLLKQQECPELASHKLEHEQLVKRTVDFQQKFIEGGTGLATEISLLLNDWLANISLWSIKSISLILKAKEQLT
ncbi:MAG: hemerythrin [Gammaproteobacteria bacterium]|nr:hemerythrin [Gammaproteobacteria bacterium]HJP19413.1 bacteriohemerythrin [Nitrospinota bacterium]|tara:strand:+ start:2239 stop:2649 length:411 start_codon:yes stop_codon:yes gene_type:complete